MQLEFAFMSLLCGIKLAPRLMYFRLLMAILWYGWWICFVSSLLRGLFVIRRFTFSLPFASTRVDRFFIGNSQASGLFHSFLSRFREQAPLLCAGSFYTLKTSSPSFMSGWRWVFSYRQPVLLSWIWRW